MNGVREHMSVSLNHFENLKTQKKLLYLMSLGNNVEKMIFDHLISIIIDIHR